MSGQFIGGVHPKENKHYAADMPVEVLPTPAIVHIPLLQHIGAPCSCDMKPRTAVVAGDLVGDTDAFVSAPVHTSITGATAKEVSVTLANGRHVKAIPVKADAEQPFEAQALFDDIFGGDWPTTGFESHEPQAIVGAARSAGLVGLGGAAFPTSVKLLRNDEKPIKTLLLNGAECEPFLTADYRLMLEAPAPIITGALLAKQATGADEIIIGIEDNKPAAIAAMEKAAQGTGVKIQSLKTWYPQGGEKQLIYAVTGKEVPLGSLPLDVGVVVMNVGTAASLASAVLRGRSMTHRIVTVSGAGVKNPKNILAPVGASYKDLIDFCGGLTEDAVRIVSGGPMMGFAVAELSIPVTKGTSGISVLTKKDVALSEETNCIRCGRCVDVCPMYLVPTRIALSSRFAAAEVAEEYNINACMECGCCAYVCPASIPLVQLIRQGKIEVRKLVESRGDAS